ncbi:unnamed protein product [Caenorhabditis bovis]|uniref:Uncharacterized protein n=1 Tax=Caenorhabditis bovis TaxID=2654633 RepID=A0A8S1EXS5_9PELO|nr:unnamed protein product [Caenorhabditis bovis]
MFGYSAKTNVWLNSFTIINIIVILYVYWFFNTDWYSILANLAVPLVVWEVLMFAAFADDDVIAELIGEDNLNSYRSLISSRSYRTPRRVLLSSGDY